MGTPPLNKDFLDLADLREVDSVSFFNALNEAKKNHKYEAFVTLHSVGDYSKCRGRFLLYDKSGGVAVEEDGNIISVFSVGLHRDASRLLLAKAVEIGGTKLDCFASSQLCLLYSMRGFIPVSKTKFNEEFAPITWNYGRDGHPDIYFWIYDKDHPSPMVDKFNKAESDDILEFGTYDEAKEYRDNLLEQVMNLYNGEKELKDE